jgi:RNA polymerase sigma-70 factor, ECF subfamily
MAFNLFRVGLKSGADVELCLESDLLGILQGTVKLEQKVTQLFEVLRDPVYHYLMAVFGNSSDAEDVTQEAFLQLYRTLHAGQSIENVRCWLFRVAHNLAINQKKHNQFLDPLDARSWDEICRLLHDPELNPEQRVLQQEKFEQLHSALGRLSMQERQCLHLRAEGFRYREIGEVLGIDTKTASEYLRRAVKKLMRQNNG